MCNFFSCVCFTKKDIFILCKILLISVTCHITISYALPIIIFAYICDMRIRLLIRSVGLLRCEDDVERLLLENVGNEFKKGERTQLIFIIYLFDRFFSSLFITLFLCFVFYVMMHSFSSSQIFAVPHTSLFVNPFTHSDLTPTNSSYRILFCLISMLNYIIPHCFLYIIPYFRSIQNYLLFFPIYFRCASHPIPVHRNELTAVRYERV